jgi:hypothetical protein
MTGQQRECELAYGKIVWSPGFGNAVGRGGSKGWKGGEGKVPNNLG